MIRRGRSQGSRHRVGIGERETRDALRKAQAPIELAGTVEVFGVNCKMKTCPEADIGVRFKSDLGRLDSCLQLVILGDCDTLTVEQATHAR